MKFSKLLDESKKNFIIYGIGQGFNLVSPILIAPYIISVCGIESFGKIGLAFAFALFLILVVDYAFDIKGIKKVAESRNDEKKLQHILFHTIYTKIVLVIIAFSIAFILVFTIPMFAGEKQLFFLSFSIVFAQVFNPIWYLQGLEDFKTSSFLNMGSKLTYVVFVFILIRLKSDYIYVNAILGFTALFFNLIGLIIIKKRFNFKYLYPSLPIIKSTLLTDFSFSISQLFLSLRQLSPLFLASYFFGFSLAGQYKIIEQIISFFRTLIQVYLKFFFPKLCYKITLSLSDGLLFWKKYRLLLLSGVVPVLILFYFLSEYIIQYFNVSIENNSELITVLRISLLIPLLMVFSLSFEQLMFTFNKNKRYIQITIFVTITNILLLLFLAPIFNLYGMIFSLLFSEVLFILLYSKNLNIFQKEIN